MEASQAGWCCSHTFSLPPALFAHYYACTRRTVYSSEQLKDFAKKKRSELISLMEQIQELDDQCILEERNDVWYG